MLRTIFFYLIMLPWTLIALLAALAVSAVCPSRLHPLARLWSQGVLLAAGVRLEVTGAEKIPHKGPLIFMSSHQSNFDIPALVTAIPGSFLWLAKKELFRIPLWGQVMHRAGYILIDRGNRQAAIESLNLAARRLSASSHLTIFPEGTRSVDGNLQPFKKGGFMLAIQAQATIVPVAVIGSRTIMPKHHLRIRPGTIRVRFFPPVATAGLTTASRDEIIEQVRRPIAEAFSVQKENCL